MKKIGTVTIPNIHTRYRSAESRHSNVASHLQICRTFKLQDSFVYFPYIRIVYRAT